MTSMTSTIMSIFQFRQMADCWMCSLKFIVECLFSTALNPCQTIRNNRPKLSTVGHIIDGFNGSQGNCGN